ncbi:type I restriction enzyme S subunit [Loktanella ponticola]|uniref:Type I restriction enzyme S subunit n=1 Tax=Yoonia ponticola TaxID=1524255 RepID=A0A7W9BLQ6_9RHOB|nr:restriction endonuclease subunit S [Yoonia ponticola]MBB5722878.1 type I restriction enzyme S subunit [Yoonia ponticola]
MNVPALRFPEFSGEWEEKRIGDIARFKKGKGISKADIVENGALPCVRYGELYTTYGRMIQGVVSFTNVPIDELVMSEGGEILIPASGETANDIATATVLPFGGVAIGGDLNIVETFEDRFFVATHLSGQGKKHLARMAQGNSVVHLYKDQIASTAISLPSLPEQKKIAAFLGVVDAKIAALRDRRAGLERYKRGLMQALFSQTLRFTKDDGSAFPDWEEKRLGEVFSEVTDKVGQRDLKTYSISAGKGWVSQEEKFGKDISGQQNEKYTALGEGDFSYNKGNSKSYKYGCIYPNETGLTIGVPSVFISFRAREFETVRKFYAKLFDNHFLDRGLRRLISSGARMDGLLNVNKLEFFKLHVPYPHPDEQQKIADALSAVDAKITAVADQLTQMETFKKGLLQQMFV